MINKILIKRQLITLKNFEAALTKITILLLKPLFIHLILIITKEVRKYYPLHFRDEEIS